MPLELGSCEQKRLSSFCFSDSKYLCDLDEVQVIDVKKSEHQTLERWQIGDCPGERLPVNQAQPLGLTGPSFRFKIRRRWRLSMVLMTEGVQEYSSARVSTQTPRSTCLI